MSPRSPLKPLSSFERQLSIELGLPPSKQKTKEVNPFPGETMRLAEDEKKETHTKLKSFCADMEQCSVENLRSMAKSFGVLGGDESKINKLDKKRLCKEVAIRVDYLEDLVTNHPPVPKSFKDDEGNTLTDPYVAITETGGLKHFNAGTTRKERDAMPEGARPDHRLAEAYRQYQEKMAYYPRNQEEDREFDQKFQKWRRIRRDARQLAATEPEFRSEEEQRKYESAKTQNQGVSKKLLEFKGAYEEAAERDAGLREQKRLEALSRGFVMDLGTMRRAVDSEAPLKSLTSGRVSPIKRRPPTRV